MGGDNPLILMLKRFSHTVDRAGDRDGGAYP